MRRLTAFVVLAVASTLAACSNDLTAPLVATESELTPLAQTTAPSFVPESAPTPSTIVAPSATIVTAPSAPVFALNTYYSLPAYSTGSGSAEMTSFTSQSHAAGYIVLKNSGYKCVYVQRAPVARFAADGAWKRSTSDVCSPTSGIRFSWSDNFWLAYDGFKFRICRNESFQADSCGPAKTIYE